MNYYGAKDLADSFRTVRKNTVIIAQEIAEERYSYRPAPNTRTVGELLAHIALSDAFQHQVHAVERRTSLVGFDFPTFIRQLAAQEAVPRTKAATVDLLQTSGDRWASWVEGLSESFLGERVAMPAGGALGASKSRFEMLLSVKEHEMHHRGQLMLVERMLGIVPHLTRAMHARMAAAPAKV